MRLAEVVERYPATLRLYAHPSNPLGFNLLLIRTVTSVHERRRNGVALGTGSGGRMDWTAEHVAAAAVRLLILDACGYRRAGVRTPFEALRRAVWDPQAGEVWVRLPGATMILDVPADVMAEHAAAHAELARVR